jgi:hypothetical protein
MRAITVPEPGVVELNFMWLPTFVGMNTILKKEIEAQVAPKLEGKPLTDDTLDYAHELIVDIILKKFPFPGLKDYLDAMKFVSENPLQVVVG